MQNIFNDGLPYETPKPTKAQVIILIMALASVTIVGLFFQISMDSVTDKYNSIYGTDSIKLVKEQLKQLKRQVRNVTQYNNELDADIVEMNTLSNKKIGTIAHLKEREVKLRYNYDSELVLLKKQIHELESRIKSQKVMLDSCLTIKKTN